MTAAQKHRRLFALHSLSGVLSAALVCAACGTSSCFGQVPDFRNLPPEERIKQMRENARIKAQEALLQYERGVQMLRADKERDPVKYENMILCVAFSAAQAGEKGRADEAFDEAFGLYQDNPLKVCPNGTDQRFWSYLSAHATASDFDLKFPILLRLSEKYDKGDPQRLDHYINDAISHRRSKTGVVVTERVLWQKVLDVRTAIRGAKDPSLAFPLQHYAQVCEKDKDIGDAEKYYLKCIEVKEKGSLMERLEGRFNLTNFYIKTNAFDKAEDTWKKALQLIPGPPTGQEVRAIVHLADEYTRAAHPADAEKVVLALLSLGGDEAVQSVDDKMEELVNKSITDMSFEKAETLLKKRVEASAKCKDDPASADWSMKLSSVYLAEGRDAESEALFQKTLNSSSADKSYSASLMQSRADTLERMGRKKEAEALKKTIPHLPSGPVKIQYCLLAREDISLGGNNTILAYDSSKSVPDSSVFSSRGLSVNAATSGNPANICSFGKVHSKGNLQFDGIIFGNFDGDETRSRLRVEPAPPSKDAFNPALPLPKTGAENFDTAVITRSSLMFSAGDYQAQKVVQRRFYNDSFKGPTRFFLRDGALSPYVFNMVGHFNNKNRPVDMQIWYSGVKKLRVGGFNALIYAPNATVEIAPNANFAGAIVANRIVTGGNNSIALDTSLLGKEFSRESGK